MIPLAEVKRKERTFTLRNIKYVVEKKNGVDWRVEATSGEKTIVFLQGGKKGFEEVGRWSNGKQILDNVDSISFLPTEYKDILWVVGGILKHKEGIQFNLFT